MNKEDVNVLVIEDLEMAQRNAVNLLVQLTCKVHVASDAASALDEILKTHYDIIFIDIQLPDMNGFELARTIRAIERRWTRMPLVAVTAASNEMLESNSRNAGFDDFLLKPITIESARHVLVKHVKKMRLNSGE
jgi:CheY-like chemotaxis protein